MKSRITLGLALLASILFLPYWAYLPLLLLLVIIIPFYWEGLFFAFLIEALYGQSGLVPMLAAAVLLVLVPLREELRWYRK